MFHLIQLACGGGEHMRDLCRVLIAKHNEPYSVHRVRDAWAAWVQRSHMISLWTVPSIGGWPYIYIISIISFWMSVRSGEDIHRIYPAKREIKHVVFDPCRENVRMACVL
ncbi:hypothetical protein P692DRAFT_20582430 [Suillus brevipes Sb2]|nr:hypothetical protein P692DRAFT_20582430 [Suillus brevipes Sb2]